MAGKVTKPADGSNIDAIPTADGNGSGFEVSKEASEIVDPAAILAELHADNGDATGTVRLNKDGTVAKKRGRKPGGATASKSKTGNNSLVDGINTLSQTLMVVHIGLASFTKFDQFALEESEALALSKSTVNVMREFDLTPDPRFTAVAGLVMTASMIYGPRVYNYSEFRSEKKKKARADKVASASVGPQPDMNSAAYNPSDFFARGNLPITN